jgi:hypothetical protein
MMVMFNAAVKKGLKNKAEFSDYVSASKSVEASVTSSCLLRPALRLQLLSWD